MKDEFARIEEYEKLFLERYRLKKRVNAVVCFIIAFCGVTAILWSVFVFHNNLINRLRYMTFDSTIFTLITSFLCGITSVVECRYDYEVTDRRVYFLRLSSATTELVVVAVVLFGLSPLVPDVPDVVTYPGFTMHLVIPLLTLLSFLFNDAPIGKLKPLEPFHGTAFITMYAVIMLTLFGFRILPSSLAPYSFLDFDRTSIPYKMACLAGVYAVGYCISLILSTLNRKYSWIWFVRPRNNKEVE